KVLTDVFRCLYFQRCGVELTPEYAGEYVHPACHLTPAILLSDYLGKIEHPKTFDVSGGWHDAGDYGRYISAAGVTIGHLLYAYELFPSVFAKSMHIPESGNGMPDLLNECLVELKWMLKMQRDDGALYHKVTTFVHAEFIMPQDDTDQLLLFPVSTMATGDFAAAMALASRVYAPFMKDFANEALLAAKRAYAWLRTQEYIPFHNPEGCNTGEYDDHTDVDERLWAAAELLRSDPEHASQYLEDLQKYTGLNENKTGFGWRNVSGLAAMSILTDADHHASSVEEPFREAVLTEISRLLKLIDETGWHLAMERDDFEWGSNMVVLNRGMIMTLASLIEPKNAKKSRDGILSHLHYLFGRNPMNTSYVTGCGEHAVLHPHVRVLERDGIDAPIPGYVSGGPFADFCDEIALKELPAGTPPMKCFVDHAESYSTNEITIYWNSPLIFLIAYITSE
ncbi:MAG: glycoside hydrolase family 9 protein, partial [Lachnospiraceae bacterium]|nr:glycoside hydrolase family 9 protein [Lachnospiraceae bacterium]